MKGKDMDGFKEEDRSDIRSLLTKISNSLALISDCVRELSKYVDYMNVKDVDDGK